MTNETGSERKTMYKNSKMIIFIIALTLCGCTRREQLVLEDSAIGSGTEAAGAEREDAWEGEDLRKEEASCEEALPEKAPSDSEPQTIFVHVCGAVEKPDVYELPAGSRVHEAVKAAGGFTADADESYVNQAGRLSDGVRLVIPTLAQTGSLSAEYDGGAEFGITGAPDDMTAQGGYAQGGQEDTAQDAGYGGRGNVSDGRININTASEAELCNIPGIGAVRAAAIVAYRQQNGAFASVEEIKNVSGIKEGTYEKIKDSIKIN